MAKTALQLLNDVGKNLRRSTGSTYTALDQNYDAVFIMQAINEAKRMVEDAWKWGVLRTIVTFDSLANVAEYDLSDTAVITSDDATATNDRSEEWVDQPGRLLMWDVTDTNGFRLSKVSREYADAVYLPGATSIAKPVEVCLYQNGAGLTAYFPNPPSGVRSYKLVVKNPQPDLAATDTEILVPWQPVVLAATAICFDERGEELGVDSNRWWERYENAFGAALARDSEASDFVLIPDTNPHYWKN